MNPVDLPTLIAQFGIGAIFLFLFIQERQRNSELHDKLREDYEKLLERTYQLEDRMGDKVDK